jgi:tRNA (guanine37-N1)-methyltransferase
LENEEWRMKNAIQDSTIPIIYFTPQGRLLNQKIVREYLSFPEVILICGHYKEIDQRIREKYVTDEISIGDYVLSGGELPAMVFTDAISRLLENVINDPESALTDSFENGLLGYPCYTRPYEFKGMKVPDVLCSGNHKEIEKWHKEKSIETTKRVRPELMNVDNGEWRMENGECNEWDVGSGTNSLTNNNSNIYIGLLHNPVYNKTGETITSGLTNMDIHDISRSGMTYNIKKYYLIHPNDRQKSIFDKILNFWKTDIASFYNIHRVNALSIVSFAKSLNETVNLINNQESKNPIIITTTALLRTNQISFNKARKLIRTTERPVLLLFGTGNGLHDIIHDQADYVLSPIQAESNYNFLSVRSAVAIVLDRLLSEEYKEE